MEEIDIYFNKKTTENQRFTNIVELEGFSPTLSNY